MSFMYISSLKELKAHLHRQFGAIIHPTKRNPIAEHGLSLKVSSSVHTGLGNEFGNRLTRTIPASAVLTSGKSFSLTNVQNSSSCVWNESEKVAHCYLPNCIYILIPKEFSIYMANYEGENT